MGLRSVRSKEISSKIYKETTPDLKKYAEEMFKNTEEKTEQIQRYLDKGKKTRGRSREKSEKEKKDKRKVSVTPDSQQGSGSYTYDEFTEDEPEKDTEGPEKDTEELEKDTEEDQESYNDASDQECEQGQAPNRQVKTVGSGKRRVVMENMPKGIHQVEFVWGGPTEGDDKDRWFLRDPERGTPTHLLEEDEGPQDVVVSDRHYRAAETVRQRELERSRRPRGLAMEPSKYAEGGRFKQLEGFRVGRTRRGSVEDAMKKDPRHEEMVKTARESGRMRSRSVEIPKKTTQVRVAKVHEREERRMKSALDKVKDALQIPHFLPEALTVFVTA